MVKVAWDWDAVDPPAKGGRALTVGAYLFASAVLLGSAVVASVHSVEFDDTGTNVVNGLHRYLTSPGAGCDWRWRASSAFWWPPQRVRCWLSPPPGVASGDSAGSCCRQAQS